MRFRDVLVVTAAAALAMTTAGGAGIRETKSPEQGQRFTVYARTVVDKTGYRYRIIAKLRQDWRLPRLLGVPGRMWFAGPEAFSVTIKNLTPGREAPLWTSGSFWISAVWRLPASLARDYRHAARDSNGRAYVNLDGIYPGPWSPRVSYHGDPNLVDHFGATYLRAGATVALQPVRFSAPGGVAPLHTYDFPERRYRAYRALSAKQPHYVVFWSNVGPLDDFSECGNPNQGVLAAWHGEGRAIPIGPQTTEDSAPCTVVLPFVHGA